MLIYEGTKDNFLTSVEQDTIAVEIEHNIYERMHRRTAKNEFRAWENSMEYMYKVLNDRDIPSDAGIAIEYNIPQTSKRVDFLISGYGKREDANVVLIELKQWDELEAVPGRDGLVQTYTGNAVRQVVHPSYQAWSYATLIKDYNASVQEGLISIYPCAYLHNYRRSEQDSIDAEQYEIYLEDAPAFTRGEVIKLRDFIKKSIRVGDHKELIYQIDSGQARTRLNGPLAEFFLYKTDGIFKTQEQIDNYVTPDGEPICSCVLKIPSVLYKKNSANGPFNLVLA